jgi:hypothetical protein|tara:strand:+ start:151 stop:285 length:135 start_codon:yes stop_codon:yes gene_type:complete
MAQHIQPLEVVVEVEVVNQIQMDKEQQEVQVVVLVQTSLIEQVD